MLNSLAESSWVIVRGAERDLLLGVIHRPPSSTEHFNSTLIGVVEHLDRYQRMQIILMGDFNVLCSYLDLSVPGDNTFAEKFRLATSAAGLEEHVQSPTRWRPEAPSSALDYVFSNEENLVDGLTAYCPLGGSDHCSVTFGVRNTPIRIEATHTLSRDFGKTNWTLLRSILSSTKWDTVLD